MTRRVERVCVVGAGLAGLACAVAAASRGLRVQVLDEADQRAKFRGYVEVVPNMLRDLVALGVGDDCVRAGFPFHGVDILDRHGRLLYQLPTQGLAGPRFPAALGISQAALHQVLERAATSVGASLERGSRVVSVQTRDEQADVLLADGKQIQADLVVLASGATGRLRSDLFSHARMADDFGQAWWYAMVPRPVELDRPLIAVGGAGQRVVMVPVRNDAAGLALIQPTQPCSPASPDTLLRESLRSFAPRVRALANHISADTPIAMRPVRSGVMEAPWHRGVVLAVGDCAHVLPPHFGQAAAQAIEDARVLGELLADASDRATLFEDFQRRRLHRARRVHGLTLTAARWDLEPESGTDLSLLMTELSRAVAQPA
jgi:2-polyprenyl-6-methoxyphenol hydroxylase-like FAD-dependent oxidoreductase